MGNEPAVRALAAFNLALAERPGKDTQAFTDAARALTELRDSVIERRRQDSSLDEGDDQLSKVNGLLSVALAGQFPLGAIPWPAIEKARDRLADIVATLPSAEANARG